RAEEYYKRALEADPDSAIKLGNYAIFLKNVPEDYDRAEEYYKRALEADPDDANNLGNYAGFLFAQGRPDEGYEYLEKAFEKADKDSLILECYFFYRYAHLDDEKERAWALYEVKELITTGVRSLHFDLSQNVARAIKDGHPEPELLQVLADVIADEKDATELDGFEPWFNAY
ncbi:tetratricopeptide repeat protein, partial [bacterium]|nr:tetratricopeptide repeat protein [bacterium]